MITLAYRNKSRSGIAMSLCTSAPVSRRDQALWMRTPLEFTGGIAANEPRVKGHVRLDVADVQLFPGTPAWRPPT